ncbi:type IX secretion system membrane protein PorP/SprF [Tamlana sp. 2_MG-2023]|uniref:PorP/SprF family type IX secretion system membrane protein n=1 Tax=unclassified Tamlana TaxID=2614803 RepID=UPI0026E32EB7|nr:MULTISPECIES: type IX secretion system membrane protein PorP/SprF [unclassified Tamlana]MDO6758853.1 type IX secretion system membrane protein PorP/SprF [Tamlana sp. 2_MG-2023]MDO6789552.1 type IX secretion system membrane protein PorP/SprF [Tamlana sp. 1_MG-2023]
MSKYIKSVLFFLLLCHVTMAQQDTQFTQYTTNMSVVNPAYATSNLGVVNLGANYRKQWVNSIGSPRTLSFFAHTPFSEKIEMGITFTSDQIGEDVIEINENNINADFAYVLDISDNSKLSLGLKAGFTLYDTAFTGMLIDPNDPTFTNDVNEVYPTIGAGAYYFTDSYYVGVSAPNFLRTSHSDDAIVVTNQGKEEIHFYMIGGYVFPINDNFKLKPSFMVRAVKGAPVNVDLSVSALMYDRVEAGLSYRLDDAISALVGFRVTPSFKVAYSYDATVSEFSNYNNGSHEIVLLFDVSLFDLNAGYKKSPRFF